ncbi:MAG: F0F1 ATP synthase subunit B [Vicingaceae bacterium]|jgi:F-type H+-transporting ATPase subunit b
MNGIFLNLLTPAIGLTFWTGLIFLILLFLLSKYAWKPILKAVNEREESIEKSLQAAEKAKEEMAALKADNEKLLNQAREERDLILKEAREAKNKIIEEAKVKANEEGAKIIEAAKQEINNQKMAAFTELKNQVATLSIEIAEKILKEELSSEDKQKAMVENIVKNISLN